MPKRFDEETTEVTVYKYGLFPPVNWPSDCTDELRGCNALWNQLCVIEKNYIEQVRAVASSAVADLAARDAVIDEAIEGLVGDRAKQRKAAQRKIPTPEIDRKIAELKAQLKEIRAQAKVLRKEAYEQNKDRLNEINTERFNAAKKARQESGLFWPNYNAVMASYERARGLALKAGRELHERRFIGEGRLTNQIQNGMTTRRLYDDKNTQVVILPPQPWQLKAGSATLRFCVHNHVDGQKREKRMVDWPFIMYRPLPDDALIKEVVVTRRKHGRNWRWAVIFTLTKGKTQFEIPEGNPVAINFGWRKVDDHALRVATAVRFSEDPGVRFTPPTFSLIEGDMMHGFEEYERTQSARSNAKNTMVKILKDSGVLSGDPAPEFAELIGRMNEAKVITAGMLIELYTLWELRAPAYQPSVFMKLNDWWLGEGHKHDPNWKSRMWNAAERCRMQGERRMQNEQANRRRWLDEARLYHYRMEARKLVGDASVLIINEHNMSTTARKEESKLPGPARHNRFMAAPSVLRQAIINYARKHGVEVIEHKGTSRNHAVCGIETETAEEEALRKHCAVCNDYYDVDVNFCHEMLATTATNTSMAAQ